MRTPAQNASFVLLLIVAVVFGGVGLYRRNAIRQRETAEQAALENQLSTSRRAADEDVTKFGEELQRLDTDVAGHALDETIDFVLTWRMKPVAVRMRLLSAPGGATRYVLIERAA